MIPLAARVDRIQPSASSMATQKARELRAEGKDIITLTQGEPDFDTADFVIEAALAAMKRGETRYTFVGGTPELKQAIRDKFKRDNGLDYTNDEVIAANGGKQVIYGAIMATVEAGDEVLIPTPYWVSYPDMVKFAGGVPVFLDGQADSGFRITPEQLRAAITPKTRWLFLNAPNNPSGAAYGQADMKALTDVLLDHPHVGVLTDDMYEHILFDGHAFCTPAQVEPALKDRTLTVNGVSKAFAMTGWRIGYAGGPAHLIKAMAKLQTQSTGSPSAVSQAAAVAALNGPHDYVRERAARFQARRDLVVSMLNQASGIDCRRPDGAFYVFPGCAGLLGRTTPGGKTLENDLDVALYFLEDAGVAVVHGAAYGLSPHFRISFATSDENLTEACQRIQAATAKLT